MPKDVGFTSIPNKRGLFEPAELPIATTKEKRIRVVTDLEPSLVDRLDDLVCQQRKSSGTYVSRSSIIREMIMAALDEK